MAGVPRRYYRFDTFDSFSQFGELNKFITVAAIIVFFLQVVFVVNFFYSIWKGRKQTVANPYDASTIEWTTPINAGHGNWPGKLPTVQRWPYDYGKDGREFYPQVEPVGEEESEVH